MFGLKQSPWIIHYDASSCNGCDIETLACLTPLFDVERLGVVNTGNPKHADIFLVTGAVNEQCKSVIRNIYEQMPEPKVVIAIGACASTGGIFRECYNVSGGVDSVIPVDVYAPGCAARPEAIIDAVVQGIGILEKKHQAVAARPGSVDQVLYLRAEKDDAPEILALQQIAFQPEAETYGEANVAPLQETLEELRAEFDRTLFIKAILNGKIVGVACGAAKDGTFELDRVMVHPHCRGRGAGRRLCAELEGAFAEATRFETKAGPKSEKSLGWLQKLGYRRADADSAAPSPAPIRLVKERS
jgi:ech hydrogenase subunit C